MILSKISKDGVIASQLLDNQYIWGYKHLYSAAWHAIKAYIDNRMISRSLSVELLLYTSGYRQINKAIELIGIKASTKEVIGIVIGTNELESSEATDLLIETLDINLYNELLENLASKHNNVVRLLIEEGFKASEYNYLEIESAILQRIALLVLSK